MAGLALSRSAVALRALPEKRSRQGQLELAFGCPLNRGGDLPYPSRFQAMTHNPGCDQGGLSKAAPSAAFLVSARFVRTYACPASRVSPSTESGDPGPQSPLNLLQRLMEVDRLHAPTSAISPSIAAHVSP